MEGAGFKAPGAGPRQMTPPPSSACSPARKLLALVTANARGCLPHPHPIPPLAASGLWGIGDSEGGQRLKVAGLHWSTPYGVWQSKFEKLGHRCLPFPGESWSFPCRGIRAETSSVPHPQLHTVDAELG